MNLKEKAMLVKFSTCQWAGQINDPKITQEVEQIHKAKEAGKFTKFLIVKEALERGRKARNTARTYVYTNSLPWNDEGWRLLPNTNFLPLSREVQKLISDIEAADQEFKSKYPDYITEAQQRLNSLFDPKQYPTQADIENKFSTSIKFQPIADTEDVRTGEYIDQATADQIKKDLEESHRAATQEAMKDLWARLYNAVNHAAEKLADPEAIFRDSLIENLIDLCDLLPRLNLTGDSNLEAMRKEVEARLTKYQPEDLRPKENDRPTEKASKTQARKQTAEEASKILKDMEAYFKPQTN